MGNRIVDSFDPLGLTVCYLGEEVCLPGHSYGPALRDCYLIHYICSGKGQYTARGKTYDLAAGQGFLIMPGELTSYCADEEQPWHYLWIGFKGLNAPYLLKTAGMENKLTFSQPNIDEMARCIRQAIEYMRVMNQGHLAAAGVVLQLLAMIGEDNAPSEETGDDVAQIYFRKADWYIQSRLVQGVAVEDVASYVGLCRSQLFRVFRQIVGVSPQEWIQKMRLQQAEKLLLTRPSLSLEEIAASSGYSGAAQMNAAFRKYRSTTPRQLTRNQTQSDQSRTGC